MKRARRNDPCPCGSGKKYKNCCLGDDARAAAGDAGGAEAVVDWGSGAEDVPAPRPEPLDERDPGGASPAPLAAGSPAPQSDEERRWKRFWRDLKRAKPDKKVQMAGQMIEVCEDLDGELAFSLVAEIVGPLQRAGRAADVDGVIRKLEQVRPEAYRAELGWMSAWRVENALLQGGGDVETPLAQLAQDVDRSVDELSRLADRLRYHGRVRELRQVMFDALPDVMSSHEIMEWGKWEFRDIAFSLLLDEHLERNPRLSPDDPVFHSESASSRPDDPERLRRIIAHASGRADRRWGPQDFRDGPWARLANNLFFLSIDFAHDLHHRRGWSRSRAALTRQIVQEYVAERASGRSSRTRRIPLEPDPESADEFLAARLRFIDAQPYRAGAFNLGLLPWMRFLCERGLMDSGVIPALAQEFRDRMRILPMALDRFVFDPVLIEDAKHAWEGLS